MTYKNKKGVDFFIFLFFGKITGGGQGEPWFPLSL